MAYDVTTVAYRQKLAQAVAGTALPSISTIVVGRGGVDGNGNPITPTGNETQLYSQVLSKSAGSPTFPTSTSVQYSITINPGDLPAGTPINEIGLKDSTGTLVSISTFNSKQTDGTTTMTFQVQLQL